MAKRKQTDSTPLAWLTRKDGYSQTMESPDKQVRATLTTKFSGRHSRSVRGCSALWLTVADLPQRLMFHLHDMHFPYAAVTEGQSKIVITDDAALWNENALCFFLDHEAHYWDFPLQRTFDRGKVTNGELRELMLRAGLAREELEAWINDRQATLFKSAMEELSSEASQRVLRSLGDRFFRDAPDLRMKYTGIELARVFQGGDCSSR